jgi:REP element-mobilizing transposase RayT
MVIRTRKQIRLKKYDYSSSGFYFVTICTQNRDCLFGNIVGVGRDRPLKMILNQCGEIVKNVYKSLPNHHPVQLDTYQIMPNHLHFILYVVLGASRRAPMETLGFIVGMFKTKCTSQINKFQNTPGQKIFQRNYYEHITRNKRELNRIRQYIKDNPINWNDDRNNLLKSKGGNINNGCQTTTKT